MYIYQGIKLVQKKNGQKEIFLVQNCAVVYKVPPNGKKSKKGKGKVM